MSYTAERIRELRKQMGLTQKDLAEKINVSPQVVSNWERDYTTPDANDIDRLADALGTTSDELLGRIKVVLPHRTFDRRRAERVRTRPDTEIHRTPDDEYVELTPNEHRLIHQVSMEEEEFLRWVEENLESSFFYDFTKSPEESKKQMMETLKFLWEQEKKRQRPDKP